jgi:hypothetical protein
MSGPVAMMRRSTLRGSGGGVVAPRLVVVRLAHRLDRERVLSHRHVDHGTENDLGFQLPQPLLAEMTNGSYGRG